jgi:hypothetical protein
VVFPSFHEPTEAGVCQSEWPLFNRFIEHISLAVVGIVAMESTNCAPCCCSSGALKFTRECILKNELVEKGEGLLVGRALGKYFGLWRA